MAVIRATDQYHQKMGLEVMIEETKDRQDFLAHEETIGTTG
jgi:hypothetical protein